jgi:hypothetical protein
MSRSLITASPIKTSTYFCRYLDTKGGRQQIDCAVLSEGWFCNIDLSHDELAKAHLRHMVGGSSR